MSGTITIIQSYVPEYRLPLFSELARLLGEGNQRLEILISNQTTRYASRGDAASMPIARPVQSTELSLGQHLLRYRRVLRATAESSLVVCEHASGALDTSALLARRSVPVAIWGHGRPFVSEGNALSTLIQNWQIDRAAHYFAYTDEGATHVRSRRADLPTTVLRNSTDTTCLTAALAEVTDDSAQAFRATHGIADGRCLVYVGALDASKRVDVLLEAATRIHACLPDVALVVAGDGAQADDVRAAASRYPWIHYIGRADVVDLAHLARIGTLILNPGRVGLVAVDSFAMGLPIVTSSWPGHAPEFAYLVDGENAAITNDSVEALTRQTMSLLENDGQRQLLVEGCRQSAATFSVEKTAQRFHAGIQTVLSSQAPRAR